MNHTEPTGRTSWAVVLLCAMIVVAEGYDLIVYGTLIPSLLAEPGWGLTKATAGTVGSLVYVGMLGGALLSGRLSDRYGRRKLALSSVAWFTVWTAACALAPGVWQLGAFRLLAGIGIGGVLPCLLALAKEYSPRGRTSLAVTIMMAGVPLGGTAASLLALALLDSHGWRFMFWVGVAVSIVILVLAWRLLPESEQFKAASSETTQSRLRDLFARPFIALTILFACAAFSNLLTWYGLNTWLTTLMRELDYPLTSALQFSLTLNVGAVFGSFVLAYLGDRFGTRLAALGASLITAVAIAFTATGPTHTIALLAAIAAMGMGAHSALILISASVANAYPVEIRATALGWTTGTGRLGAIMSPWLGGAILSSGADPTTLFWTFTASALLSAVVLTVLYRIKTPTSDPAVSQRIQPSMSVRER
ncbi:MAG: aromatic acid/H+ symport family MFS transporter [Mycobacterium sp.]